MSPTPLSPAAPSRPPTLAVVAISGAVMRYAEVEATDAGPRVRRLGTCDFDMDAEAAIFGPAAPVAAAPSADDALDVVADALRDVFAGTAARSIVVAAAATTSTTFFTPLPVGMSAAARDEQFRQEAALLADVPPATPVRVRAVAVRAERASPGGASAADRQWYHVLHVGEAVHARLARLALALGVASYDIADTARAAAAVARALAASSEASGVDLIVGAYGGHTEVAVVRDGALLLGHHGAGTTPEDTAYFALAALDVVGASAASVGRLLVYGDALGEPAADGVPERLALLTQLAGAAPRPLDALALFGRPVGASPWELAAFAPVLGAALEAVSAAATAGADAAGA